MNNEEFKKQLSESDIEEGSNDGVAYRRVFDALSREPEVKLSQHFSEGVIQRISAQRKRSASRDNFYLFLGVLLLLISAIVGIILSGFKPDVGVFKFLAGYRGLVIFAVVFILGIQWLDKRIVKKKLAP